MTLTLFDQFLSPTLLGIPLILLSTTLPWTLLTNQPKKWMKNRLTTLQSSFIYTFTKQTMSPINLAGQKWALLLMSLMTFLVMMNLLGLLPYTFTPTTQLSMNMALATPMWLATVLLGFRHQMTKSLGHLLPEGTPTLLIPPLILIETTSLFIRPLALGVRLTANLTAGHLLIQLIATASLTLATMMPTLSLLTFLILLLLAILELAVAIIQAYVFTLLLSLYLQENA
uniref:ATP synthase subunit a n=1 Tax=Uraeotyphlus cf. oxyurus MW-212 TaxID=262585 RepID=Q64JP0_9AMPH|nr:ATP synthase F0 subunit 6 [Uraeotyphlus cf. oxyurus MW-212]AAS13749.1 ATP synthase F0 subunit 6 [Uraeotyphlus cf. oxyurus MW-212]